MSTERVVHIVEDDASVRRSLQWLLQSAGFATKAYSTAFACLDAAPQLTEGCLLLDIKMPEMDGLQLQGRLAAVGVQLPRIRFSMGSSPGASIRLSLSIWALAFARWNCIAPAC